jgi:hypothetical protein
MLLTRNATAWLQQITPVEKDMDTILQLVAPDLYNAGADAIQKSKALHHDKPNVMAWPSSFSGIAIISNRMTIPHRDSGGWSSCYDLLLAGGNYGHSTLDVPDLNAKFVYNPGTVIAISGKVLRHSINGWQGGERLCIAHYMRNNVHHRLVVQQTRWPQFRDYMKFMSPGYVYRSAQDNSAQNATE